MKYLIFASAFFILMPANAQSEKRMYTITSAEVIFSFADIKLRIDQHKQPSTLRFSPGVNLQCWVNKDLSAKVGFFTGLAIRNVGFSYRITEPLYEVEMTHRTYNLGLPIGIKVGNLSKFFLYAGYELELPIHYKEKTSLESVSDTKEWFSDRVQPMAHSFMAGVQAPFGVSLKFKYYVSEFMNQDYAVIQDGRILPYRYMNVHAYYFSLNLPFLRNTSFYYKRK